MMVMHIFMSSSMLCVGGAAYALGRLNGDTWSVKTRVDI